MVNLLGYFSPLTDDCELYDLLHGPGVKTIYGGFRLRGLCAVLRPCRKRIFNIIHQKRAAEDFHDRLKIPIVQRYAVISDR